ncbi:hypothetical protein PBI_PBS1_41 [Bacillus phage PBS1]|uniref:Uncharacterized protein n=1 Tax=Bacillus phage PBS1 TaxID=2884423 RepID=A0A223LCU0_BPPB1|nr:virion structural protein [Bacillus phage PBS1]AST99863.1 hypothetical protein PBI_PBS1_41 [Bacillus phage PBS1]BDE75317.1 hypothetical protein [Bacillus phage PBS1]
MSSFFNLLTESNTSDIILEQTFQEANVVRMDKQTLKKRLLTQATLLAAKDANDPIYQKYVKAAKQKRHFRSQIQQKYGAKGQAKVREFLKQQQQAKQSR